MKPNNVKIIGITGGIATGKSTVSNIIKKAGYIVIDADKIAREVMKKGAPAYEEIIDTFGKEVLKDDKTIDRKKLGNIIFADILWREKLNNIVHPYIFNRMEELIDQYSRQEKLLFLDIPLLIEELDKMKKDGINLDEIWLVYVDEATQLDRLMKRDSIDRLEGIKRIKAQMPIELKREYATRIIDNRGDLEMLNRQMIKIMDEII
ncbi:MAG: dephospho-CoA kinase [Tissierellia bacterium]|nr:dephospho-CoA kinase [Tissierellia bacterium]